MGVEQAIEQMIAGRKRFFADNERSASAAIKRYRRLLRKHFSKNSRAELAVAFVAFCERRIGEKFFRRRVKTLFRKYGIDATSYRQPA